MAKKTEFGYVYIFTNESFREDWVKIGKTQNIEQCLTQFDNTSCPLPFDVYAYLKTRRYDDAEAFVHEYISLFNQSLHIRPNREYFKVAPEEALDILVKVKNLMNEPDAELVAKTEQGIKLVKKMEKKRCSVEREKEYVQDESDEDVQPVDVLPQDVPEDKMHGIISRSIKS